MEVLPLKTKTIVPRVSLASILDKYVPPLNEGNILVITSKIVSLCENRTVATKEGVEKIDLIKEECEAYIIGPYNTYLTLKDGVLMPTAGIDESNSDGGYILLPQDAQISAEMVWTYLKQRDSLESLGVIITDSHSRPLRRGVTGVGLGWSGFKALRSYIGHHDLHGKPLQYTVVNVLDSLSATAVLVMGEGHESTPMAVIKAAPHIEFQQRPPTPDEISKVKISLSEDLYEPLINSSKWIWTGK